MKKLMSKFITILTTILLVNVQENDALFCYQCLNTPNSIYPSALPCPGLVEFSLMSVVLCDDVHNSCVMFTERNGDVETPIAAGCAWKRIEPERQTTYYRSCQNGRCENHCATDYCRYGFRT